MEKNEIVFSADIVGNSEIIMPDSDGYYPLNIGALNVHNSVNEYYSAEHARKLFGPGTTLDTRARKGVLRSEYGHPRVTPGMSAEMFKMRLHEIYEDRVCAHFQSPRLVDNKTHLLIKANVKPEGPNGKYLKESLDNPKANVYFSIRSFSKRIRVNGKLIKHIKHIVTWDYVNEGGISMASKFHTSSNESFQTREDAVIDLNDTDEVQYIMKHMKEFSNQPNIGLESSNSINALRDELTNSLNVCNDNKCETYKW